MKFTSTPLEGACVIELQQLTDERGFFARQWCQHEFEAKGLTARIAQVNVSYNHTAGTLRGMHYQVAPHQESKLVRCTAGAIYDVIVDLRKDSETYLQWFGVELTSENHKMLFVPEDFGHGFQTLANNTEVTYQVSEFYTPGAEQGLRHDDPAINIEWPRPVSVISEKDAGWDDFQS